MKYKRKDRQHRKKNAGKAAKSQVECFSPKLAALMKPITAEQLASCEGLGRIRSFSGPSFEVNR